MYEHHDQSLAYLKQTPLTTAINSTGLNLKSTVSKLNQYFTTLSGIATVETEALTFYMLNHAHSLVLAKFDLNQKLPEKYMGISRMYYDEANHITVRMVYYTLLIITREARHLHKNETFALTLKNMFGETFIKWYSKIPSGSSDAATYFRKNQLEMGLGAYLEAITFIFNKGKFTHGYGGKPWGIIADTLRKMVFGEITPEMFVDTAWTLAHNNGPMFNKGMLYTNYTSALYKILDVQRSGQIPQLIGENGVGYIDGNLVEFHQKCKELFPDEFGDYVDWYKVEALGSLHSYPNEKAKQDIKYGVPITKVPYENENSKFYLTSNEYALIIQRKKAA